MKRTIGALLLILTVFPSVMAGRPKVALVLSGGGAKGAAHIGVIKVLKENDIPVDMVVGVSMGAVVGGLYCAGYSGAQMDSLMMIQDWNKIMFDGGLVDNRYLLKVPLGKPCGESALSAFPSGAVRGTEVEEMLGSLLPGIPDSLDFDAMPTRFACVSVDLIHKKEVIHHSGNLVEAIRASMSIPLFFEPVRKDGMLLIDGGMLNNYPVDVARAMGADIVIGVKVGEPEHKDEPEIDDIVSLGSEWLEMYIRPKTAENIAGTDIFIGPSVGDMNVASFRADCLRKLIDNGEIAAREVLPRLRELALSPEVPDREIQFDTSSTAKERVCGHIVPKSPKKESSLAVGGYFDTEEIIAARVDLALNGNEGRGHKLNVSAKLAYNLQAEVRYGYDFGRFGLGVDYDFRNTSSNIFKQEDVATCRFREHTFGAFAGYSGEKNLDARGGVRVQMFHTVGWSRYLDVFAIVGFDNWNHPYFPDRGIEFRINGDVYPALLSSSGTFGALGLHFSGVIPVSGRFALIATVDHRSLISGGNEVPYQYGNWMGGLQQGRYFDQQFAFIGFNHVNPFGNILTGVTLDARTRFGNRHYLTASGAYAFDTGAYRDISGGRSTFGARLGYSYDSMIGPLSVNVSWSNLTKRIGLYAGVGLYF